VSVPSAKELKGIIALCRKTGVKTIKFGDIEITLGDEPLKKAPVKSAPSTTSEYTTDAPSEEELLFWSAQGLDNGSEQPQ
jgi:hypothetical protein